MFEWDEEKRQSTLRKHGIDFIDAVEVLMTTHLLLTGRSETEQGKIAVGSLNELTIAVVFTMRDDNFRIITARRARKHERESYQTLLSGRPSRPEE